MPGVQVTLDRVSRSYPTGSRRTITAIDDVSLGVAEGEVVAVSGPSGSGKSTLLHLIGAMDHPDHGSIRVGDRDVGSLSGREQADYRRTVGFVFQRFHLLPALTVQDNVLAPLLPYRARFNKAARARELLAAVGLADRAASLPSHLSGGEQQRVAIARALVADPGVLLADEPTGKLDSTIGGEIVQLLLDLRHKRGMTVIVATHDPLVAARCDRVVRLLDGRVVEDLRIASGQDPDELLDRISGLDA